MNHRARRQFPQFASAAPVASVAAVSIAASAGETSGMIAPLKGRIYKTLKFAMIREGGTLVEKFAAAREAGFEGVELRATQIDPEKVNQAIAETGLLVDGSLGFDSWKVRHSDPDPAVRAKALEYLRTGLRQTHAVGGHSLLVVVGHGKDGTESEVWKRSVDNISKAIPLAAELGVMLCIENVWNDFCYDPNGGSNQKADSFIRYVDAFRSPWVRMHFDIGNHWKFASVGDWIRSLGKRIVKLDIKGFSRGKNSFTKIGAGDIDFTDVRKALIEIDYHGWCAAEVKGGDLDRLKEISRNMDRAFAL